MVVAVTRESNLSGVQLEQDTADRPHIYLFVVRSAEDCWKRGEKVGKKVA